jgi:tRNA dimethylallyltransferase
MLENGAIDEVRNAGTVSVTAAKMIGLDSIQSYLSRALSISQCQEKIQRATRQYAKRQLTWFRRQTNFQSLNLSELNHLEAVKRISQLAKTLGVAAGND